MDQSANKWWWFPGALLSVIGLLVVGAAEIWGAEEVWIPVGLGFIAVAAFMVHRARPRSEVEVGTAKAA